MPFSRTSSAAAAGAARCCSCSTFFLKKIAKTKNRAAYNLNSVA
jgi:hypothetical protein